jgi:hypothetical protein
LSNRQSLLAYCLEAVYCLQRQYLIKWAGCGPEHNWEPESKIRRTVF